MELLRIITEPYYLLYLIVNSRDFNIDNNIVKCSYEQYIEKDNVIQKINQLEFELSQTQDDNHKYILRECLDIFNTILNKISN